ncbi:MAG: four helix bundle protein [Bacteroidales bacterium]|nr:four helix bundle protein [Bacteroidales bacterium]
MNKFDLEERLIDFVVLIIELTKSMPASKASNHLIDQIIRSTSSSALNYGEAQSGESRRDFIHKIKIVLKELRESYVCLKIIYRANLYTDKSQIEKAMHENNELISIFVKSAETAQKNMSNKGSH